MTPFALDIIHYSHKFKRAVVSSKELSPNMASVAVDPPSLPRAAQSRARLRHCEKSALACDECLAVLALDLATELGFESRAADEMSLVWYLTQLNGELSHRAQAVELQRLVSQLCMGLDLLAQPEEPGIACSGGPSAEEQEIPMQAPVAMAAARANPRFWVAMGLCAATTVGLALWLVRMVWRG